MVSVYVLVVCCQVSYCSTPCSCHVLLYRKGPAITEPHCQGLESLKQYAKTNPSISKMLISDVCMYVCIGFSGQGFSVYLQLSRNSLCRPGWPQTHRDLHTSASLSAGIKGVHRHSQTIADILISDKKWLTYPRL